MIANVADSAHPMMAQTANTLHRNTTTFSSRTQEPAIDSRLGRQTACKYGNLTKELVTKATPVTITLT